MHLRDSLMLQGMGRTHYPFGELHTSRLKPNPENGKQESSKYTAKNKRTKIVARCASIPNTCVVVLAPKLWAARFNSYAMSAEASGNRYKYCDFTVTLLPKVPGSKRNALTMTQARHKLYLPSTKTGLAKNDH